MATLNFPDDPTTGDEYYDSNAGFNYEWNGTVWITKNLATPNNTREIDDISSGFDGSDTTFTLKVEGVNIVPESVKQLVISVGGVMQNPGDDYTVSGSTLTFTTAPLSGLSFTGTFLGVAASLNTITAGSVSPSSLTATSNYTVGSIKVSGASTVGNFVLTGLTTITDPDVTNLNSSGVGTVSNVIITGDNSGLGATVGAAVGVVTYFGDASNMTGVGLSIFPLSYGPGIGSTDQSASTDITTTWNYPIQAGSGTITIRTGSGSGTIVDQFVVGSSSSITISERTLTLNPAANLDTGTEHFVVYPAGVIKSTSGQKENNQLVTSFTTVATGLYMWGRNEYGLAGSRTNIPGYSSPVQIPGTTWNTIMKPQISYCAAATKTDGTLWAWGLNGAGCLGLNDTAHRSSPTQVGTDTTWTSHYQISEGASFGIKTDNTLWVWGSNSRGYLGLNEESNPTTRNFRSSPTQLPGTWASLSSGDEGTTVSGAIKTDGTLWMWGWGQYGELGNDSSAASGSGIYAQSSPVQVPGTTWSVVRGGGERTFAGKTDGTLWIWGTNQYGQLGLNQAGSYPSGAWRQTPTQIGTSTDWNVSVDTMTTGDMQTLVIKTDGTLWSWGANFYGDLGLNNTTKYSSPTQIGTETTWSKVAASAYGVFGLKTDGSMWGWGSASNTYTAISAWNDNVNRSSPTQIPGTWTAVTGLRYNAMGIKQG